MSLKICKKCEEAKPATTEFYHRRKACRDGLNPVCKVCRVEELRLYNQTHREAHIERVKAWQSTNQERVNGYKRKYREGNKGLLAEKSRIYSANNKERKIAYQRVWRETNKEYVVKRNHAYYQSNKLRYAESACRWRAANRDAMRARDHRHRARKLNVEGSYTALDIKAQYERQDGKCYYCKSRVGNNYHVDHVVPMSRGGSNSPENIVIACPKCNQSKGDKLPHEWTRVGALP